ncbi:MAG: rhodanese-like domain-containing protein [Candidatus Pacebacteria bacterium]|nr:rhodanese-like domain-containing protein [Candidatus Paceibacterota bacterium]
MTPLTTDTALCTTAWLAENLSHPQVKIVDCSFFLPAMQRDAKAEFAQSRIAGSVFFDIDAVSDHNHPAPHMLPSPTVFAAEMNRLGIGADSLVLAYDRLGLMSAARLWWSLRVFGHDSVWVLDGGFPKWLAENHPCEGGAVKDQLPPPMPFVARYRPELVKSMAEMVENIETNQFQVFDARSRGRFNGTEAEPRPGLASGHIPSSHSLPFTELLAGDKTVLPPAQIRHIFEDNGYQPGREAVVSCGSGVTACVLALGLYQIGVRKVAVYDGSWGEWGASNNQINR